jgi:hypothetical protein
VEVRSGADLILPGWLIFLGTKYQNGKNIPNNRKIYQIAVK